jgi:peptidoglycan/xylan/chitin deacetylase (PgdA/CDA1 family)
VSAPLANRDGRAVFLCYHSIAERGPEFLALPPGTFERQLDWLRRHDYAAGGFAELRRLGAGERLDRPTVFLTFDDGFRDNAEVMLPLAQQYGFRPIVFVLPTHLEDGGPFTWPEVAADQAADPALMRSLTWAEVEDMVAAGVEIGSHTLSHRHLPELDDAELARELTESKALIERRLGSCEMVAYPFGEWDARVAGAARDAGYSFGFSLPQGPQKHYGPHCIPRVNVDSRDDGARFAFKLSALGRRFLLSPGAERLRVAKRRLR